RYAKENDITVLVTDHHLPGQVLPDVDAMVNPNLESCHFPSKALAGVGVAFYLMMALCVHMRKHNWFTEQGMQEPKLMELI
ncbi:single-stranded-DNA-specific exonuclease RecJ, partial [Vibrio parahaemolyticus]|nr:single-stranded-DNA-specific exonuclease RecJ [Vibrio parahaemolyticus]